MPCTYSQSLRPPKTSLLEHPRSEALKITKCFWKSQSWILWSNYFYLELFPVTYLQLHLFHSSDKERFSEFLSFRFLAFSPEAKTPGDMVSCVLYLCSKKTTVKVALTGKTGKDACQTFFQEQRPSKKASSEGHSTRLTLPMCLTTEDKKRTPKIFPENTSPLFLNNFQKTINSLKINSLRSSA